MIRRVTIDKNFVDVETGTQASVKQQENKRTE
jgi:hypothetical protein